MKELANTFDTILKSDMCHEEQLEKLLEAVGSKLSQQREEKTRIKEAWEKEIELKTKHVREDTIKECIGVVSEFGKTTSDFDMTQVLNGIYTKLESKLEE